jgi:hypothetical protein
LRIAKAIGVFLLAIITAYAGIVTILSYHGIKAKDIKMPLSLPHWSVLVVGLLLLVVSVSVSGYYLWQSLVVNSSLAREIEKWKADYSKREQDWKQRAAELVKRGGQVQQLQLAIKEQKEEIAKTRTQQRPSKLVVHSATYAAINGKGKTYNVTEFMQHIIAGDSLVLDIENHNFVIGEKNFVPQDPCFGEPKRLQVTYSYDGEPETTVERPEHSRIVLPQDSERERLSAVLGLLDAVRDAKPATGPQGIAGKARGLADDLYSFLKEIGPEPNREFPKDMPDEERFRELRELWDPWHDRMFWGYEHKFKQRVVDFIVELRANRINPNIRELSPIGQARDHLAVIREQAERLLVLSKELE